MGYKDSCYVLVVAHYLSLKYYVYDLRGKFRLDRFGVKKLIIYDCEIITHLALEYHLLHEPLYGRNKITIYRHLISLVHDDTGINICQLIICQHILVAEVSEYRLRYLIIASPVHTPDKALVEPNILEILLCSITVIPVISRIVHPVFDEYTAHRLKSRFIMTHIIYLLKHLK